MFRVYCGSLGFIGFRIWGEDFKLSDLGAWALGHVGFRICGVSLRV